MKRSRLIAVVLCVIASLVAVSTAYSAAAKRAGGAKLTRPVVTEMKEMGMSPEMILRCRMLMQGDFSRSNPSSLLGVKDELKLTDEQVTKLKDLGKETRDKARAVLTEEQLKKIDGLPLEPSSGIKMHRAMVSMLKEKGMPEKCPIMAMGPAASRPAAAKAGSAEKPTKEEK